MTELERTVGDLRDSLDRATEAVAAASRQSRGLPSSRVDGVDWGEVRQTIDEALASARVAVDSARLAIDGSGR